MVPCAFENRGSTLSTCLHWRGCLTHRKQKEEHENAAPRRAKVHAPLRDVPKNPQPATQGGGLVDCSDWSIVIGYSCVLMTSCTRFFYSSPVRLWLAFSGVVVSLSSGFLVLHRPPDRTDVSLLPLTS